MFGKYWIILCFLFIEIETVLIGIILELTIIPSFLGGTLLPLILIYIFSKKNDSSSIITKWLFYKFFLSFKSFKHLKCSMKTKYIDLNILN